MGDTITPVKRVQRVLQRHTPLAFHNRIAIERIVAGLTVSHCARALGYSHTLWQKFELGTQHPTAEQRKRIAHILGVTEARLRGTQHRTIPGWKRRGRPRSQQQVVA